MRKIRYIQDVVDWGLCVGCGACYDACEHEAVTLVNIESIGIRPRFDDERCEACRACLEVCPGYTVDAVRSDGSQPAAPVENAHLLGRYIEVWEGFAADPAIRQAGSSGAALTALALYCLEQEGAAFVLHSGMNSEDPCCNQTVQSRSRDELLGRTGSRYAPAAPCEQLRRIERSDQPCVFIGKPCDAAAASMARVKRPELDAKLSLVLTFFCAGTPSTNGTKSLLRTLNTDPDQVNSLRYRGDGWPGGFSAVAKDGTKTRTVSYEESWSFLQRYRPFRCQLCPDGVGQVADLSCGDAWHRYSGDGDPGRSLIIVRTERGAEVLKKAVEAGYLSVKPSPPPDILLAQKNLLGKRTWLFGRLLAMRLLLIPVPRFRGYRLFENWLRLSLWIKAKTVLGTLRRLLQRGLWHRNPLFAESGEPVK